VSKVDSANFKFTASPSSSDLTAAFERYQPLFFPNTADNYTGSNVITGVDVSLDGLEL